MITVSKKLITPQELKGQLPISNEISFLIEDRVKEIQQILARKDLRKLLIIGPCSADNEDAFYSYLSLLSLLEQKISNKILIIPRLYTTKSRSKGDSYKGIVYSEDPSQGVVNIEKGLRIARRMYITAISAFGFICADEMLHTDTFDYFDDVAAYAVIGARNSESQQHRFLASGLDIPVAIKNPTSGDLDSLTNAVYTAQRPNSFIYNGCQVKTSGNEYAHAVLRGGVDREGRHFSNYSTNDLIRLKKLFSEAQIKNPSAIIDVNHSNSGKNYQDQTKILLESIADISNISELHDFFAGYMVESYIKDGATRRGEYEFGKSVTDACLGWEKTEELILKLYELL